MDYGLVYCILYSTPLSSYQLQSNHRQIDAGTIRFTCKGLSTIQFQSLAPVMSAQCSCLEGSGMRFIFCNLRRRGWGGGYIPASHPQEWRMEGYNSQLTSSYFSFFSKGRVPFAALPCPVAFLDISSYYKPFKVKAVSRTPGVPLGLNIL